MRPLRFYITSPGIFLKTSLAASLLIAVSLGMQARAELPPVQTQGSTEYLSGGFGQEESSAIKQAMPQFSLALTFASQIDGKAAYTSDVQVVIRNDNDANVLNVASEGPFLLVRLAPGHYQVFVTHENQTQSRKVSINTSTSTRLTFEWNRPVSGPD
ncbi:carboxypeptidase regulatory-like domain-containing protein [Alcaligenaceae bacterium]|nr:carboxypeptidase regulatory-like domain-containing protein [Alcaligenaceae bacterium]